MLHVGSVKPEKDQLNPDQQTVHSKRDGWINWGREVQESLTQGPGGNLQGQAGGWEGLELGQD